MLLAVLAVLAVQDPAYATSLLESGDRADHIEARDLDGDGRPDLLIQNGRDLEVFLQRNGAFGPKPSAVHRLDPSAFLWCLGTVEGSKRLAVFAQGSKGIHAVPFDGAAFGPTRDVAVHPTLFEGMMAEGRPPLAVDFAPDLDRDGRSEALLFHEGAILVMKAQTGGAYRCAQKLPVPIDVATIIGWAAHMTLLEVASVPVLSFGDADGDGRPDVTYYRDESVGVFRQKADGSFDAGGSLDLTVEKSRRKNRRFFQFDFPPKVGDFNGDGILDIALIYPSKGRVHAYYGRAGRTDFTQPDDVMKVADGWSSGVYVEDLDGDGKQDLIMGVVRKFGITEGIQVFLSGKLDLELHLYPMQSSGRFTPDPVQELKFSIPYSFHVTRESGSFDLVFRPNFRGDFNKDGLRDMLVLVDSKTLKIYPGSKDRGMAAEPTGSIAMNPPEGTSTTEPYVADLNGDGVSDLVLKHIQIAPPRHVLELKVSRP